MTKSPVKKPTSLVGMAFDEALVRLSRVDRKELEQSFEDVAKEEKEVGRYVEDRERSIKRGARRSGKRFRL